MNVFSYDTETTGIDLYHKNHVKPFLISTCDRKHNNEYWRWTVDPKTRQPQISSRDKAAIQKKIDEADIIIMHNSLYDVKVSRNADIHIPWEKVHDTMFMSHIIDSQQLKALEHLALRYLRVDIKKFESEMEQIVKKARQRAKRLFPEWKIASNKLVDIMPSAKETIWKFDLWLPEALSRIDENLFEEFHEDHVDDYANIDTMVTMAIWQVFYDEIFDGGDYEKIYKLRMELLPIVDEMQESGLCVSYDNIEELTSELENIREAEGDKIIQLANSYGFEVELPVGSVNNSVKKLAFEILNLPVVAITDTGAPSLSSKDAIPKYLDGTTLELDTDQYKFVEAYSKRTKASTKIGYLASYNRFQQPVSGYETTYGRLHPNLKACGTKTLRWASSNPNEQQIDKFLRYAFVPDPGFELWALDYNNLELRIPAYESGEPEMLKLFEKPGEAPYFGSYHMLIFDLLHPKKFKKHGMKAKEIYKATWYQYTKNGNFADQYGAVDTTNVDNGTMGTADRAYHMAGAQAKIAKRLTRKAALNQKWVEFAEENGYVYTVPDKELGLEEGYPLQVEKTKWGKVKPTIPLNYHVQGTAGWIIMRAMINCWKFLKTVPQWQCKLVMQVHDELVFMLPKKSKKRNLPKIRRLRGIMERVGDALDVPLKVGIDYHPNNYRETE